MECFEPPEPLRPIPYRKPTLRLVQNTMSFKQLQQSMLRTNHPIVRVCVTLQSHAML